MAGRMPLPIASPMPALELPCAAAAAAVAKRLLVSIQQYCQCFATQAAAWWLTDSASGPQALLGARCYCATAAAAGPCTALHTAATAAAAPLHCPPQLTEVAPSVLQSVAVLPNVTNAASSPVAAQAPTIEVLPDNAHPSWPCLSHPCQSSKPLPQELSCYLTAPLFIPTYTVLCFSQPQASAVSTPPGTCRWKHPTAPVLLKLLLPPPWPHLLLLLPLLCPCPCRCCCCSVIVKGATHRSQCGGPLPWPLPGAWHEHVSGSLWACG